MKPSNQFSKRIWRWSCLMTSLFVLYFVNGFSQLQPAVEKGVIRLQVTEKFADQLEHSSARMKRGNGSPVQTGIQSFDQVTTRLNVSNMKRVFRHGGKFEPKHRKYGLHLWYEVELDPGISTEEARAAFSALEFVERADPLYRKEVFNPEINSIPKDDSGNKFKAVAQAFTGAPNDTYINYMWAVNNTGQFGGTPGSDLDLYRAWTLETGKSNVVVAVIDGGIDVFHTDLMKNIWMNDGEIPGNEIDDDNNGYIDDIYGYGFGDNSSTIYPHYHGTHVAGTIAAATNNHNGVAGIAGGSGSTDGVSVMSCAVYGSSGVGNFDDAFIYAADNGAVIAQSSWSYATPGVYDYTILRAIDYFIAEAGRDEFGNQVGPMNGGIAFFAAGNENRSGNYYPAYYLPTVAVASVNDRDQKAYYSNYGNWIDISAPGGEYTNSIYRMILSTGVGNTYTLMQGTSMACPQASGVAALIVSKFGGPGLTPAFVRGRILESADNIEGLNPAYQNRLGSGRLNAYTALLDNDNNPPDAISNLTINSRTTTSVLFNWTAPGEAGKGITSKYDLRYSASPITASNFSSATPAPGLPVPHQAGTGEVFLLSGLNPDTQYYFAIKSIDFYGNASPISNVIQQRTDIAPIISVIPGSFEVELLTSQSVHRTLTINNSGTGELTFNLEGYMSDMIWPSIREGNVASGESLSIDFELNARQAYPGVHSTTLRLITNDPNNDTIPIPIIIHVSPNGFPILNVEYEDSIVFYHDYIGGVDWGDWKYIINDGSEPLTIYRIESTNPLFDADVNFDSSIDTIVLAPFESAYFVTQFNPVQEGTETGEMKIYSNDPNRPLTTIPLKGMGFKSPKDLHFSVKETIDSVRLNTLWNYTILLWNEGVEDVSVQFPEYDWDYVDYSVETVTIHPGDSLRVLATFNMSADYFDWLPGRMSETYIDFYTDDPKYESSYGSIFFAVYFYMLPSEFYFSRDSFEVDLPKDNVLTQSVSLFNTTNIPTEIIASVDTTTDFPASLLSFSPISGVIGAKDSLDLEFTINSQNLEFGTYTTTLRVDIGSDTLILPVAIRVSGPPQIEVDLTSVDVNLTTSEVMPINLPIGNQGGADLHYSINTTDVASGHGLRMYRTGFEEMRKNELLTGQRGWYGASDTDFPKDNVHWTVSDTNPFGGSQHLHGVSDDTYSGTFTSSPVFSESITGITIVEMMVAVQPGPYWRVELWASTGGITSLEIAPDGNMTTYARDSSGGFSTRPIPRVVPAGYFKLRFSLNRTNRVFTIQINDELVFSGIGLAQNVSRIGFFCGREAAGYSMDVDDIRVYDGDDLLPLISVTPQSGKVSVAGLQTPTLKVDARNIDPGVYTDTVKISSNDPNVPVVSIPVKVFVNANTLPELAGIFDTTVVATESLTLTLTASDVDDTYVQVYSLFSDYYQIPVTFTSGNGYLTYTIKPRIEDIGNVFFMLVMAKDAHGGIDSRWVHIEVLPFHVDNFSFTQIKSGTIASTFVDTVVYDIAQPDIDKFSIQANTRPLKVGSVKFTLDGVQTNLDNSAPYMINAWLLPNLSEGYHTLTAQAFTHVNGQGTGGAVKSTIVHVVNSSYITDFDVVDANGIKLMDLEEGSVIDINQPGYGAINIVTNTNINTVRSVRFLWGDITARIDNRAPYALSGNSGGSNTVWSATPGHYTLTAIPYMMYYGWGPRGIPSTVNFTIVRGAMNATARSADESIMFANGEQLNGEDFIQVYPVPARDHLTIYLSQKIVGDVQLSILNAQGQLSYSTAGSAESLQNHTVSTVKLGLGRGVYFVILQQSNGKRFVKKFITE